MHWKSVCAVAAIASVAMIAYGQTPLRTQPAEKLAITLSFRDWSPAAVAGSTVVGGNQTGGGGLFAVDAVTGKLKWSFVPKFSGTSYVASAPAIAGPVAIGAFPSGAVIAVALATGKEVWRGPRPALHAEVGVSGGVAYYVGNDGAIYALDAGGGVQRWKAEFNPTLAPCHSRPIFADGAVILTAIGPAAPNDPTKRGGYYLFAFDAATGQERWRYRAEAPYVHNGVCLTQPVLVNGTVFATGESRIYAVDAGTGKNRWAPILVQRVHEGRMREVRLSDVVSAGGLVIAATPVSLLAVEPASGRTVWEAPGKFQPERANLASAGSVLYFQGSPESRPAERDTGTLYALDVESREILWSFARKTSDPAWSFGKVAPVNGGLWVDTYRTLLKLE